MNTFRTLVFGLSLLAPIVLFGQPQKGLLGFNYELRQGYVQVTAITPGMPAATQGLAVGDYILSIDGYQLYGLSMQQLAPYLSGPPGKTHALVIQRGSQQYSVRMTRVATPQTLPPPPLPANKGVMGFNFAIEGGYLKVTSVTPGYPAASAGMLAGDWILAADGYDLSNQTLQQASAILAGDAGSKSTLTLQRGTQRFQVTLVRVSPTPPAVPGIFGFNYQINTGYIQVTAVTPAGPAARNGLLAGDWILAIDGTNLVNMTMDSAKRMLAAPAGTTNTLLVQRGQQKWNVNITRVPAQ